MWAKRQQSGSGWSDEVEKQPGDQVLVENTFKPMCLNVFKHIGLNVFKYTFKHMCLNTCGRLIYTEGERKCINY